ncbi:MAG: hypothetical protein HY226_06125 [Candidatus Vogelbacteria bacterium]|nr:hypothetical protein [Candidatus Vogelbacteria bacterium]
MFLAFLLIVIGAVFLLKNLEIISLTWEIIWPVVLIGLGVYAAVEIQRWNWWKNEIWNKLLKKLFGQK